MKLFIPVLAAAGLTLTAICAQAQTTTDRKDKSNEHTERVENKAVLAKEVVVLKKELRREEDQKALWREQRDAKLGKVYVPDSTGSNHLSYGSAYVPDSDRNTYGAVPTTGDTTMRNAQNPVAPSINTTTMNHNHPKSVAPAYPAYEEQRKQADVTVTEYDGGAQVRRQQRLDAMDKDFGAVDSDIKKQITHPQ
jgi:hypothetical protein